MYWRCYNVTLEWETSISKESTPPELLWKYLFLKSSKNLKNHSRWSAFSSIRLFEVHNFLEIFRFLGRENSVATNESILFAALRRLRNEIDNPWSFSNFSNMKHPNGCQIHILEKSPKISIPEIYRVLCKEFKEQLPLKTDLMEKCCRIEHPWNLGIIRYYRFSRLFAYHMLIGVL